MSEMQCEICGAEISGVPREDSDRRLNDGGMQELCALRQTGRQMVAGSQEDGSGREGLHGETAQTSRPFQGPGGDWSRNTGTRSGKPGRAWGYSPEELGLRIKEKAALLKKIEREEISPEDEIRKKLEKELKIKLTDLAEEAKVKSSGV